MAFIAWVEPAVAGQPRHRPLDHPPATPQAFAGVDAFAGDADTDALAPEPSPQVGDVVCRVRVQTPGLGLVCVGFVSHGERGQHRLQREAVEGAGRGDSDP